MNYFKHVAWATAVIVSIVTIAIETRKYNIEEIQQRSFMLKVNSNDG
jgi:hypothetical protein